MNRIEISLEFIDTLELNVFQPQHFHLMKGFNNTLNDRKNKNNF